MNNEEYLFESEYGFSYSVTPYIDTYANNDNLYLGFYYFDKEDKEWAPFCSATVNTISLPYMEAAIDVNNNGPKLLDFLEANGFGERTPFTVSSGFCVFPIFHFNEDKIREIDPKVFAEYRKAYGMDKLPLDQSISRAETRTAKAGHAQNAKEAER